MKMAAAAAAAAAALLLFILFVALVGGGAGEYYTGYHEVSTTVTGGSVITCNAAELRPCAEAITSATTTPTLTCCSKLKEQRPCLCNYMKNPFLKRFINSPNANKVAIACGTPFPTCT